MALPPNFAVTKAILTALLHTNLAKPVPADILPVYNAENPSSPLTEDQLLTLLIKGSQRGVFVWDPSTNVFTVNKFMVAQNPINAAYFPQTDHYGLLAESNPCLKSQGQSGTAPNNRGGALVVVNMGGVHGPCHS